MSYNLAIKKDMPLSILIKYSIYNWTPYLQNMSTYVVNQVIYLITCPFILLDIIKQLVA
jgi:hypothetical protein